MKPESLHPYISFETFTFTPAWFSDVSIQGVRLQVVILLEGDFTGKNKTKMKNDEIAFVASFPIYSLLKTRVKSV